MSKPDPKKVQGARKVQLQYNPPVALAYLASAMEDGVIKYGVMEWRNTGVDAMTYIGAAQRHLDAWRDGEEYSPDTVEAGRPVHHLSHAMASIAILIDAMECGMLEDNRPPEGPAGAYQERVKKRSDIHPKQ